MLLRIVGIVFPLFIIVMAGFAYGARHRPEMVAANRMNMEVFLPALIFSALASKSFSFAGNLQLIAGTLVVAGGSGLLGWLGARLLGHDPKTMIAPVMFNNVGNMGVPLMLLTFGNKALGAAIIMFLVMTLLQFIVTPWIMHGRSPLATLWREPFMVAALLGLGVSVSGINVWPPLLAAAKIMGDISLGLMIFSLGVRLSTARLNAWGIGLAGAILTPLSGLAMAWLFCLGVDCAKPTQDALYIFGALPPAVSNFIFAERYGQEPDKVASIVIIGNMLSIVFVPLALALRL
jgi:predicted permease